MSLRERLSGIWLIAMTLLSLFAFTVFFVAQMWLNILFAVYLALPILQSITLIIYMWGPEKLKSKGAKVLYRVLYASSVLVIPCFAFIFFGLVSQYHVRIPDSIDATGMAVEEILPGERTTVYDTGTVYVIFPEYTGVELACEKRPSKDDGGITWRGAVRKAAEAGGSGFMQFGLIRDGENVMNVNRPRARCYRTLAELNGSLCIIDSVNMLHFEDFMAELHRLGVKNALYMDMGAGWNYSWYRDAQEKVITLFGLPVPWSHNWIVFRK